MNETIVTLRSDFGAPGIAAARAFISQVYGLFSLPPELPSPGRAQARHASFALAGLAVLADWIGSRSGHGFLIVNRMISRTLKLTGIMRKNRRTALSRRQAWCRPAYAIVLITMR